MSSRASGLCVAVLKGGPSREREVSLVSGTECASALSSEGFKVVEIDAGRDLCARLEEVNPDVAFNALHGKWGEDGCVQGILEWLGIPYTHSGVQASALGMDKLRSKVIFSNAGLPCAEGYLVTRDSLASGHPLDCPYVLKPVDEGSSVGVHIVQDLDKPLPRLNSSMGNMIMVERYVPGRELTVSVLTDRPLTVTDIRTDGHWYDYSAKYEPGGSYHVLPADIPGEIFDKLLSYASKAHRLLGCRGLTRADFRWDENADDDGLAILEVNTQPGMTPTSLSPEQAQHCGIGFGALCRQLVEDASCQR